MAEEAANGRLSETENERVFRTEILPDYLPDQIRAADCPTLIVLGGQPGSGKTALLIASQTELERTGGAIRIVGDDLRSYHPGFVAHQSIDPVTASRFTQGDAGIWTEKLLAAATSRRVHVVFETTMRTPDNVEKIMKVGRSAGYRVEARALAVSPRVSWQGCHYRFEELHQAGAAARIPPRAVHDGAVTGLAESLKRIERRKLADRVVIQSADGEAVYDNQLANGRWRSATIAAQVLDETRNRPLTREEVDRFAHIWTRLIQRMEDRRAPSILIDEVKSQSRDDLAWFQLERRRSEAGDAVKSSHDVKQRVGMVPAPAMAEAPERIPTLADPDRDREKPDRQVRPGDVLIPGRELADLSEAEIVVKLRDSSRLAEKRAEIDRLSMLVYGNSAAVSATVERIDGPMAGAIAGEDARSGKLGPLAGEGKGFFRAESPERQAAKAHLPQLAAALEDYGRTVDFERYQMETKHRDEQYRQRQEIRAPSEGLEKVLAAPEHERAMRLNATPELRRELERISASISRRLDVTDRTALRRDNLKQIAQSLNVSAGQAASLSRIHKQTEGLGRHVQTHSQTQHGNVTPTLKR
ncbi:zeta toxin family protein [Brucella grignonensis]|uniref:AAA domain protein n=1 Tax=Brucella grignonensis TaxID=94627 RepID=A0A256FS46_9HYPH|nr:zeta toxin family protein [Brucella grignonensis]OYR17679.1 AAA domain protein [Brucella grignonensis]